MYLVVGLGLTGQSVLRYLQDQSVLCLGFDTRSDFDLTRVQSDFPQVDFAVGSLPKSWCDVITTVVLSPGVAKSESWLERFHQTNVPIIGDIELFARAVSKPVIAITGSNGKSTVATLTAQVLETAGYQVGLGGNIGVPALDLLLEDRDYDVFVLELSSFQLETTYSLQTVSATVLNISEDHMDRYAGLEDYLQAKMTILNDTVWSVLPYELSDSPSSDVSHALHFGLNTRPLSDTQYGYVKSNEALYLGYGQTPLLAITEMALPGEHHQLNALATMALCRDFDVSPRDYQQVFSAFKGLPHRTQWVADIDGVQWINDSKGTNVGATLTAVQSLAKQVDGKVILIAGGVGKDADFSQLAEGVISTCRHVVLFGRDQRLIEQALTSNPTDIASDCILKAETLSQAVTIARDTAIAGDAVLFSPACASFDQFANYIERGKVFEQLVQAMCTDALKICQAGGEPNEP